MSKNDLGTALITGASSGIGAAFARQLAARGYDCVLVARRRERLEALAAELRRMHDVEIDVLDADLGAPGAAAELHRRVRELDRPVRILVNNAGFGVYGELVDQDLDRVREMLQLNAVALTELTHLYARDMVQLGGGHVLQVASVAAFQPSPLYAVYAATKAYVLAFSAAANAELRKSGVSVTTLNPGLTDTEFHAVADHVKPPSMNVLMMSADSVAQIGLRAMFRRRAVVTAGWMNKLAGVLVKFLPRSLATSVAYVSMKKSTPALPATLPRSREAS